MRAYFRELRDYIAELYSTRELLANLTMRDVKGKYRRTALGQLWSLLNPLATMVVYTFVFFLMFRASPPPAKSSGVDIYALWLMCGLLPWHCFTNVVHGSITAITGAGHLIKKVYFPRMNLPFSIVGAIGFSHLNEMAMLTGVMCVVSLSVRPILFVPVLALLLVLLAMFSVGLGMMLSVVNVHFRDTEHFTSIVLRMALYLTPVMYPISGVASLAKKHGHWLLDVYTANPMLHFIDSFRAVVYDNVMPDGSDLLWVFIAAIVTFCAGFLIFERNEKKLALWL